MKKILLLGTILILAIFVNANNNLVIFTLESKPFYVVLNGIRQNYSPETNVKIKNLPGDFYRVKVVFEDSQFQDVEKTVNFLEPNQEVSMELKLKKGQFKLRYAGARDLADNLNSIEQPEIYENSNNSEITYHNEEWSETEQQNYQINVNISGSQQSNTSSNNNTLEDRDIYYNFMPNGTLCSSPDVNDKSFLDFKYHIENANMFTRQEKILKYFQEHCMTSSQIEGIIIIDYPTVDAKTIAKEGYRNTYDTENYYLVLDALTSESDRQNVIKFLGLESSNSPYSNSSSTSNQTNNASTQHQVNYSLIPTYSGYVNCNKGILLNDINNLINAVNEESFGDDKLKVIQQATKNACLKVSDIEKLLEEFNHSSDKMDLLKWAWDYTYDIDNFFKLSSSLTFSGDKEELDQFIDEQPTSHFQYVYSIDYSDGTLIDADDLEERMEEESFSDNKMTLAKQALVSRYISVKQIKQLAPQFSQESDLLEFIEMAYPRTLDQESFHILNEILTFSSSKDKLKEIMGE
jgi:hypothetical protein